VTPRRGLDGVGLALVPALPSDSGTRKFGLRCLFHGRCSSHRNEYIRSPHPMHLRAIIYLAHYAYVCTPHHAPNC
jgi:hypothetical protein